MACMSVLFLWVFRTRRAEIIALDFVLTVLAINVAMLFDFWQDCASYFFTMYAVKEVVVGYCIGVHISRQAYCASGVFNAICGLEMNLSESLVLYDNYGAFMLAVCIAKMLSAVDWNVVFVARGEYGYRH